MNVGPELKAVETRRLSKERKGSTLRELGSTLDAWLAREACDGQLLFLRWLREVSEGGMSSAISYSSVIVGAACGKVLVVFRS